LGQDSLDAGFRNIVNLSFVKSSGPKIAMPKAPRFDYLKTTENKKEPTLASLSNQIIEETAILKPSYSSVAQYR
jgi:hypothetical protein